jgi:hypothetical protein
VSRTTVLIQPKLPVTATFAAPISGSLAGRAISVGYDPALISPTGSAPAGAQVLVYDPATQVNIRVPFSYVGLGGVPVSLSTIGGLTPAADRFPYYTGAATAALATLTPYGRSIIGTADDVAARVVLNAAAASHTHTSANVTDFAEAARDTIGAALVQGAGISIVVNDGADTITITNTSSSSAPIGVLSNASIAGSVAASALTVTLNDAGGSTPSVPSAVSIPFRNATATNGTITQAAVSAASTIVVPSTATLGFTNATAGRVWVVAFNDAGTIRLGVINCRNGVSVFPLAQFGIASSTAIDTASDNAGVFYTGVAVTNRAYSVLGYLEWPSGLTTAGTWDTAPPRVETFRPGMSLPGQVIQIAPLENSTYASSAATIPFDNTEPQISEGASGLSGTMTPSSAANLLRVSGGATVGNSTSGAAVCLAAFRSDQTNALSAQAGIAPAVNGYLFIGIPPRTVLAASTSSLTFSLRYGGSSGTSTFNGSTARQFGTSQVASLLVEEIVA